MSKFLDEYRRKRTPGRTPEPFGDAEPRPSAAPLFVVQKHSATRLHYDLRLEWDGVLKSWAVPKGPSPDPAEKRFAVQTEDHPLEYADFEGVIPEGEYGAGPMIVWDRGRLIWHEDPREGVSKGKLLFELRGHKLKGLWTLVRLAKGSDARSIGGAGSAGDGRSANARSIGGDWLLIKETKDAFVRRGAVDPYDERSILSGFLVEEVAGREGRLQAVRDDLERLGAPRTAVSAGEVQPMLAETRSEAFDDPAWLFELKLDGFRAVVERDGSTARIYYRRGAESTAAYPDLCRALTRLPAQRFVADGEIAVLDETGRPVFQRLQRRALLTNPLELAQAAADLPASLFLFDLLGFEDFDLRTLPLVERKRLLRQIIPPLGTVSAVDHVEGQGRALFASIRDLGLEGIVAKRAQSPYRAGRSRDWQKVRIDRTGDFVVVGFTAGEGSRSGFGALHVAQYRGEELVYLGRVGGGFSEKELKNASKMLGEIRRDKPPFKTALPLGRGNTWVEPRLVVEVRYKEITEEGLLRQPTFLRFRTDKAPEECVLEGGPSGKSPSSSSSSFSEPDSSSSSFSESSSSSRLSPSPPTSTGTRTSTTTKTRTRTSTKEVALSNLDKIFWPDDGYTKGDLIDYYRAISQWMLPYLRDRPIVLTRYPNGIAGKSFFQKDAPEYVPSWIRRESLPGGGGFSREPSQEGNVADFFIVDDVETLLYLANLGNIPIHTWSSRVADIKNPDWCILDLDPKTAPFSDVLTLARATHELCEQIGLPAYCKTSGQKGLHVLFPMGAQLTHEQSTSLAELIARAVEARHPKISSTERSIPARKGRVYLDYLQNGYGKTIVGPFSVRPIKGASVSMPLKWSEVNAKLDPKNFTIKTAPARMKKLRDDPLAKVLSESPDIPAVLQKLGGLLK
ncbi:MAG TPA: DNA ligase D [Myxococcales bacterium]|jgi:bifunctional non-homologous end joining protein LigD